MVWVYFGLLALVAAAAVTAAWAGFRAAPFVPTAQRDVERMLRLAGVKPGDVVYDLGCGDGRFLITAAKRFGATAVGYEISLLPYLAAQARLALSGVRGQARVVWRDFFRNDLSGANVVICFLTPGAMRKLAPKFRRELKPGTRIVSYAFALPEWTPVTKDKPAAKTIAAWVYQV